MLVAGWAHQLLHFLIDVATCGLLVPGIAMAYSIVLVVLTIFVPLISETSSRGATKLRRLAMALRSREHVPSAGLDITSFVSGGLVVVVEPGALLLQWRQSGCDTPDLQLLRKRC
jgi:hypothetical protein